MKLKNKVAVITGGSSGIGLEMAKEFIAEGASVVICGRNRDALEAAQQKLGKDVHVVQADISKFTDLDKLYTSTVKQFGKIDVLVANASGDIRFLLMDQIDEPLFDSMNNNIFKGTFFTIQKALPHLNDNASIITFSATGQSMGFPGSTVAAANKAAVRSLVRGVSADLLPSRGIRANCISPGPIDTPLFDKLGIPEEIIAGMKENFKQQIPLKRFGTANEVAKVALFLASSDSSFIVGEEIKVGGGDGNLRI